MVQDVGQQEAYILNRRAYQESSLIVDVFSMRYGRFSIVAKGAMRGKKPWSSLLQAFQPVLINWSGRASLKTLRSVEAPSKALTLSSGRLFSAYYLNELLIKLLPEFEVNTIIFFAYASALQSLDDNVDIEIVLRLFELGLLRELGLAPDFMNDIGGDKIQKGRQYIYKYQQGFECVDGQEPAYIASQEGSMVLDSECLIRLDSGAYTQVSDFTSETDRIKFFRQSKKLMRSLILQALGGQKINSRDLFTSIKF